MKLLSYYEQYPLYKRELAALDGRLQILARDGNADPAERAWILRRADELRGKMEGIRRTLARHAAPPDAERRESLRLTDERLFLECRYIQGMTVEKAAEAMCVSRDTAFRIRRRLAEKEMPPSEPSVRTVRRSCRAAADSERA